MSLLRHVLALWPAVLVVGLESLLVLFKVKVFISQLRCTYLTHMCTCNQILVPTRDFLLQLLCRLKRFLPYCVICLNHLWKRLLQCMQNGCGLSANWRFYWILMSTWVTWSSTVFVPTCVWTWTMAQFAQCGPICSIANLKSLRGYVRTSTCCTIMMILKLGDAWTQAPVWSLFCEGCFTLEAAKTGVEAIHYGLMAQWPYARWPTFLTQRSFLEYSALMFSFWCSLLLV